MEDMADYKVNFKELKSRVGIDDIAYSLGYRLDRKAGVGRYIELVLGNGNDKRDTLIISNPRNKSAQTFFRRDGSKGDVVTLIRENLNAFFVSGKDDWEKIAKVMARFANMPEPEYREDREFVKSVKADQTFDASRYEVKPVQAEKISLIFSQRGLSADTVKDLSPYLTLLRDKRNDKFDGYNAAFPYTDKDDKVKGYEIRGFGGYKSKAAGTDSSSSAWVADLSGGNREAVKRVFFFESAFDAMAFYQVHKAQLDKETALVSIGGTFSDGQITGTMARFPYAKAFDCFDNDLAGRIYGLRMMALLEEIPMKISKAEKGIRVEAKGKSFLLDAERPMLTQVGEHLTIRYKMGQWLPPKMFKDWNDCLLNKPMKPVLSPNKNDRDNHLAGRRNTGVKL